MKSLRLLPSALASILIALAALPSPAQSADPLEAGFRNPPASARPHTWWHWMNGNITREGITADLEAMQSAGVGGAQIFNVDSGIPHGPVQFMSPEWRALFQHAVKEANRLGLELCVHNCAGWSSSGGPWNTPEHAMQKVVTSELPVKGPSRFNAALPQPATTLNFYRDIAVLAFPSTDTAGTLMRDAKPAASTSTSDAKAANLLDGDAATAIELPVPTRSAPQFAQLEFREPFSARAVLLVPAANTSDSNGEIQVSDDGKTFRTVRSFAFGRRLANKVTVPLGPEPVSARYWRVNFIGARNNATRISLAEIELNNQATIESLESKAGFDGREINTVVSDISSLGAVAPDKIVDLTSRLDKNGRLNWDVPAGEWIILRIGYTPTGRNNHPAPTEATGLECDKLSREALDLHWAGFMQKLLDDVGPLAGRTLNNALIDSYEVGGQNWTAKFREEFRKRRGYDLLKFLPAFSGRVVDNPEITDRFLWDVRRTVADLMAENYFGHFAELCKKHGLLTSIEPYTGPFESLQCGAPADIVMGEFWSGSQGHKSIKIAASVAHIYGKQIVGAESFTARPEAGRWLNDPWSIKALGDLMFCQGLNRYIFHRYAMQPWTNRWPGMTMGQWGFHFERTVTWWNQGKAWLNYVARCQSVLQQGRVVADVAYFCGENAPVELRSGEPATPAGFDWDAINADVLQHRAAVKDGRLTLPNGVSYAALILPPADANLTPALLKRIRQLAHDGLTVIGRPPEHSPSLENYPECDAQVKEIARELWAGYGVPASAGSAAGPPEGGTPSGEHTVGKGRIIWGKSLSEIFAADNLRPDFEFAGGSADTRLAYVHRVVGDADIYFVSNQRTRFDTAECTFRVSGKTPELWHPDSGEIEPAPVWREQDGRTTVRLMAFDPAGSVFVVFRGRAAGDHAVAATGRFETLPGPGAGKIEVRSAVYEAPDGAGSLDVKEKLARLIDSGQFTFEVRNDVFGVDPAVNHSKQLRLEYAVDGKPASAVVPENESFTFPSAAGSGAGEGFDWQPFVEPTGAVRVRLWNDGDAELRLASGRTLKASTTHMLRPVEVVGPWTLRFPPGWGAPASVQLDKLISWPDHKDDGVRYFSGRATYSKEIEIPAARFGPGREVWLDLGDVKNFAEVALNGKSLGTLWKPPFRIDATGVAQSGTNRLEIRITNLWPNRLIGDEQLPADCEWNGKQLRAWPQWLLEGKPSPTGRLTFTTWHHWTKDSHLLESGLLGPVTLRTAELIPAE